ncbi:hypothetical protein HK405_008684 [Cladochytrium tenue]|nr:hypothetical protein HK405_008684 [Cladochytrium tenue]
MAAAMPSFPKYMWAVAFTAGTGGFLFGYEIGIINQILSMDGFLVYFGIDQKNGTTIEPNGNTDELTGLVTSSFLYGCVVGAAIVSFLADLIGRKFSIVLGGLIYTAGGTLQAASTSLEIFLTARALSGVSVGIMSMCVPLYIAETAPTRIRGRLTTVYQLMITFGILVASCVNGIILTMTDEWSDLPWRMAFTLQVIPGITLLVLMLPMPRSPRWLAEKGLHTECQRVITRLRGAQDEDDDEVVVEFRSIVASVEYEKRIGTAGWRQFLGPGVRRRLAIGVLNQFFQQWTGINVILYYGASLFAKLGFDNINASVTFIIINAFVNFAFTLPGMWGVERFGRRPLFIGGGIAMSLAYVGIFLFAFFSLDEGKGADFKFLPVLAVMSIYLFTISFSCTWGPTVWTYQSEIFPLRIRAKGTGLSTMSNWIWNAVIAQIHPMMLNKLANRAYLVFACTCFVMTLYAWKFIPETRGKTLEEMDEVFKDSEAVLPSEGAQFSATMAALFSLRGHRPPVPPTLHHRHQHHHGGGGNGGVPFSSSSSLAALSPFTTVSSASSSRLSGAMLTGLAAGEDGGSERQSVHSTLSTARRSGSFYGSGGGDLSGKAATVSRTSSPLFLAAPDPTTAAAAAAHDAAVARLLASGGAVPGGGFDDAVETAAALAAPSSPLMLPPLAAPFSASKRPLVSALKKQSTSPPAQQQVRSGGPSAPQPQAPVPLPAEELAMVDVSEAVQRAAASSEAAAATGGDDDDSTHVHGGPAWMRPRSSAATALKASTPAWPPPFVARMGQARSTQQQQQQQNQQQQNRAPWQQLHSQPKSPSQQPGVPAQVLEREQWSNEPLALRRLSMSSAGTGGGGGGAGGAGALAGLLATGTPRSVMPASPRAEDEAAADFGAGLGLGVEGVEAGNDDRDGDDGTDVDRPRPRGG